MCDNMVLGLAVGFAIGAIWVNSNKKASEYIDEGKQKAKEIIEKI